MMSPTQRAAWLKRNPLPEDYGLIHVSELEAMHDQLVLHREALEQIGVLLGPYLVAAKGDPVAAVQRVLLSLDHQTAQAEALRTGVYPPLQLVSGTNGGEN